MKLAVTVAVSGARQRAHSPATGAVADPVTSTPSVTASNLRSRCNVGADRYPGELETQVGGGRHGQLLGPRGTGLAAERAHVKDKRAARRVRACIGHDSVLVCIAIAEPSAQPTGGAR